MIKASLLSGFVAAVLWALEVVLFVNSPLAVAEDCNSNGFGDRIELAAGLGEDCNLDNVPDECEVFPFHFGSTSFYRVGVLPRRLALGDLNGDGQKDIVTGFRNFNGQRSGLSVLINGGRLAFSLIGTYDVGRNLLDLQLSDMDGDGDDDVVVLSSLSLFLFDNLTEGTLELKGTFDFLSQLEVSARGFLDSMSLADLDGDGLPEVILTHSGADQIGLLWNGEVGLQGPVFLDVGSFPRAVATGDFDGNGIVDLAVTNNTSAEVMILAGDGRRSFDIWTVFPLSSFGPTSIFADDLDADDDLDLLVTNRDTVSVLLNDGSGDFSENVTLPGPELVSSAVTDLDNDGDLDLALGTTEGDIVIRINDGEGRFNIKETFEISSVARDVTTGDFDGDGDQDFAFLPWNRARLGVLWNEVKGDEQVLFDPARRMNIAVRPHTIAVADVDGDGDEDVLSGNNVTTRGLSVLFNNGLGEFGPLNQETGAVGEGIDTQSTPFSIVARDFDGDGDADVASSSFRSWDLEILLNTGEGAFESQSLTALGAGPFHLSAGDLDDNGFDDVVSSNVSDDSISVLFNDGTFEPDESPFTERTDLLAGLDLLGPVATALVDFDRDGRLDIAVANTWERTLYVLLNLGNRVFGESVSLPVLGRPRFVVAGDLDGDDWPDLITANTETPFGRDLSIYWNQGGGVFQETTSLSLRQQEPFSLTVADLDGDSLVDIVTANQSDDSVSVLLNDGGRVFSPPTTLGDSVKLRLPIFALPGDFDGDGDLDIVTANHGSQSLTVITNRIEETVGSHLEEICTLEDFFDVSISTREGRATERVTKYIVPARSDPDLLPALFQDVDRWDLHLDFLIEAFPERFSGLNAAQFDALVGRRVSRDYFIGALSRVRAESGFVYVFNVVADTSASFDEVLNLDEIQYVYDSLSSATRLRPLHYFPGTELARREADSWQDPPFEIFSGIGTAGGVSFESYTVGVGYGHVRVLSLRDFERENRLGLHGSEDILVIDEAPRDIQGVVGGVITSARQGTLSHVSIRTARRGTPNAYVLDATERFEELDGKLIRLEVFETEFFVVEASLEEAEGFWAESRPSLEDLNDFDADYRNLDTLNEIDLTRSSPESVYGGKAANFARLQRTLGGKFERYRESGFAIPMHYYIEFMRNNRVDVNGDELTYQEFLDRILSSASFQGSSTERAAALAKFRDIVRDNGVVDPELVQALATRVPAVFGSDSMMVRFRSSSNVEDSLKFNGAGLYDSASACVLDSLDRDSLGPSRCDPTLLIERNIREGLKQVWASLWSYSAFEERRFFQVPPEMSAMGVLVSRAFLDEKANGVAFTGNPRHARDRRYVVTAQKGEASVVSPSPGVTVERSLLELVDGRVVEIVRERSSSLVEPGETVVSDQKLRELGELMWHVEQNIEIDLEGEDSNDVLLDFEFKIEKDDSLAVKQVRPFLIPKTNLKTPTFKIEVPPDTTLCAVFSPLRPGREAIDELEFKSTMRLRPGIFEMPTDVNAFEVDLIEELLFSSGKILAVPTGPGVFRVQRIPDHGSQTSYEFSFEQEFTVAGTETLQIRMLGLDFVGRGAFAVDDRIVLDEGFITFVPEEEDSFTFQVHGALSGKPVAQYSSCTYSGLPVFRSNLFVPGTSPATSSKISLVERFLPAVKSTGTGAASLVRAELDLEGTVREVNDYWKLVYSAHRHNVDVIYWTVLDPPVVLSIHRLPVHVVEVFIERQNSVTATVLFLGENLSVLGSLAGTLERSEGHKAFVRGDVNSDGRVDITDIRQIARVVLLGDSAPACEKTLDADDNGKVEIFDAMRVASSLFGGLGPLPAPSDRCDVDPTADILSCPTFSACP